MTVCTGIKNHQVATGWLFLGVSYPHTCTTHSSLYSWLISNASQRGVVINKVLTSLACYHFKWLGSLELPYQPLGYHRISELERSFSEHFAISDESEHSEAKVMTV